jgi:hypothetical protein
MSNDIEQLKAERQTIMDILDTQQDAKMGERLIEINHLLNNENKYSNVYYRGFGEYIESTPNNVGEKFRKQIENGEYIHVFFPSHPYLLERGLINLSPITPYDYNNTQHQKMMKEKYVIRLTINPHKIKFGDERIDISAHLSFSYYDEGNLREIDLDIYVREGFKWSTSGINWSAMGTTDTCIASIYAEMMLMGCKIHNSLSSVAMSIKHTNPAS